MFSADPPVLTVTCSIVASPWQRGSNENTNGLLRQYFPRGTDLSVHTAGDLAMVTAELNARPRKTLRRETPSGHLDRLIATSPIARVLRRPQESAPPKWGQFRLAYPNHSWSGEGDGR